MPEVIQGLVTYVMDRKTISLEVTHVGDQNTDKYQRTETVRVLEIKGLSLKQRQEIVTKLGLEKVLRDCQVRCYVDHRDSYHRVVGKIHLLQSPTETDDQQ